MFRMFGFFCPRKIKIIVLINHEVLVSKVALISTKEGTQVVDIQTFAQGLKECYFVSVVNMNSFYFYNNNQVTCTMRIIFAILQHFNDACKDSSQ